MTAGEPWPTVDFELAVNGATQPVSGAWVGESLLFALRERLGLVAAKDGCGEGECGACTVLMDGQPAAACLVPAVAAVGRDVRTPEIYAVPRPDAVGTALAARAGAGCGFCLPGIGMELRALLARNPKPGASAIREALSGHRCRCLPAERFVEAMQDVQAAQAERPAARTPGPATLETAMPDRPGRAAPAQRLDESGSWSWQSGAGETVDRP
jgi:carbon-monoxide dehydrogenase small subunit